MKGKSTQATERSSIEQLTAIVNVGPSIADDLRRIGIKRPQQLTGRDPWLLYDKICAADGLAHDPCVLDVLMSAVDYMNGNPPKKWWKFTAQRKKIYANQLANFRFRKPTRAQLDRIKKRRRVAATA